MQNVTYKAVVMGASTGGGEVLGGILSLLPRDYALPILIVQHLHSSDAGGFSQSLQRSTPLRVLTPCDKQVIEPGAVYVAPANYHMLCERTGHVALSVEEKVNWSRPSIDVLFDSARLAWGRKVIAVILSGANKDGAKGICDIRAAGGLTLAQDPRTAECAIMPQAAIDMGAVKEVLAIPQIAECLMNEGKTHG